jgi:DNA topoisomerase-1
VNAYLKDIAAEDFTSKDFRTWAGTVLAARALLALQPFESPTEAKRNVVQAIEVVARQLGNTQAVCRKCYVHPAIVESYLEGKLLESMERRPEEAGVLAVLQASLKRSADEAKRSGAGGRSLEPILARSLALAARRLQRRDSMQLSRGAT